MAHRLDRAEFIGFNAMCYGSPNREVAMFLKSGVWRYDRQKDAWARAADGDGSVYVVDYDPQHNVFLASRGWGRMEAFRLRTVAAGTKAFYCGDGR